MTVEQLWHFHRSPKDPCPFLGDNTELEGGEGLWLMTIEDLWHFCSEGSHVPFFLGVTPS